MVAASSTTRAIFFRLKKRRFMRGAFLMKGLFPEKGGRAYPVAGGRILRAPFVFDSVPFELGVNDLEEQARAGFPDLPGYAIVLLVRSEVFERPGLQVGSLSDVYRRVVRSDGDDIVSRLRRDGIGAVR